VAVIWTVVFQLWRWLGAHTTGMIERALAWSHRHPVLGRYSEALIDPNRPESASLLLLALVLAAAGWGFFSILISVGGGSAPSDLDLTVHQLMFGLRNPLADTPMAFLASLGDAAVLTPAVLGVFVWLLWRRRRVAAWHWLAAPAFALVLTWFLGYLLDMPKPPASTAVLGFSFPSASVTLATVVYGFFAVLIARELPGRSRAWPYVAAALIVSLLGFARLYLGAHWLSDVLAGTLLGLLWIAALGIAYRRRVVRSFWVRPISTVFFVLTLGMAAWHGSRGADETLARFDPPLATAPLSAARWWAHDWQVALPSRRNELSGSDAWPLNVQYAGRLDDLRARLLLAGWEDYRTGGWVGLLQTLDKDATPDELPILPSMHEGRAEALVMVRREDDAAGMRVLRLWAGPVRLQPGDVPMWIGTAQELRFTERLDFFSYWQAQPVADGLLQTLAEDAGGLEDALSIRDDDGQPVLRLRPPPPLD
jgi:membrane-associated phospholipid phosphatase